MTRQLLPPAAMSVRLAERLRPAWDEALQGCRGLHALTLDCPDACDGLAVPHRWALQGISGADERLQGDMVCDAHAWPLRPDSLDAVCWQVRPAHLPWLSLWLAELVQALGPQGRLVVQAGPDTLDAWVRVGMPLCELSGLRDLNNCWADGRRLTRLPPVLGRHWDADWHCWFPGLAQGTVQIWRKEVVCGPRPLRRLRARRPLPAWTGQLAPQPRLSSLPSKESA